jgi:hypothetical protein
VIVMDKQRIAEWMQTHDDNVFDDSYVASSFNIAPQGSNLSFKWVEIPANEN